MTRISKFFLYTPRNSYRLLLVNFLISLSQFRMSHKLFDISLSIHLTCLLTHLFLNIILSIFHSHYLRNCFYLLITIPFLWINVKTIFHHPTRSTSFLKHQFLYPFQISKTHTLISTPEFLSPKMSYAPILTNKNILTNLTHQLSSHNDFYQPNSK